jgi:hypothetical protein
MTTSIPADSPLSPENAEATTRAVQASMTQQGASNEHVAFAGSLLRDDKLRAEIAAMETQRQREHASFMEWLITLIKAIFGLVYGVVSGVVGGVTSLFASKDAPSMAAAGFVEKNRSSLRDLGDFDAPRGPKEKKGFGKGGGRGARDDAQQIEGKRGQGRGAKNGEGPAQDEGSGELEQGQAQATAEAAPKRRKGFSVAPTRIDGEDAPAQYFENEEVDEDGLTDTQRVFVHNGDMSHSEALAENRERGLLPDDGPAKRKWRRGDEGYCTGHLVEHGAANFEFNPEEKRSYYVKIERPDGTEHIQWGKELEAAMTDAAPGKGDLVNMVNLGKVSVEVDKRIKEGDKWVTRKEMAERNSWRVDILEKAEPQAQAGPRIVRVK